MRFSLEKLADALDTTPGSPWARTVRLAHEAAVVAGVAAIVVSTQPGYESWHWLTPFVVWVLAVAFAIEFLLRVAIAPWAHWAHNDEPWRARWHWATNFAGLVDL